jgi:hypothetical protein
LQAYYSEHEQRLQPSALEIELDTQLQVEAVLQAEAMIANELDELDEITIYQELLDVIVNELPIHRRNSMRELIDAGAQGSVERLRIAWAGLLGFVCQGRS